MTRRSDDTKDSSCLPHCAIKTINTLDPEWVFGNLMVGNAHPARCLGEKVIDPLYNMDYC
jgi:hypothetical protein